MSSTRVVGHLSLRGGVRDEFVRLSGGVVSDDCRALDVFIATAD